MMFSKQALEMVQEYVANTERSLSNRKLMKLYDSCYLKCRKSLDSRLKREFGWTPKASVAKVKRYQVSVNEDKQNPSKIYMFTIPNKMELEYMLNRGCGYFVVNKCWTPIHELIDVANYTNDFKGVYDKFGVLSESLIDKDLSERWDRTLVNLTDDDIQQSVNEFIQASTEVEFEFNQRKFEKMREKIHEEQVALHHAWNLA